MTPEKAKRLLEIGHRRGFSTISVSGGLRPALETIAGMQEEWGVAQDTIDGTRIDWCESDSDAALYRDHMRREAGLDSRLVRRYVTASEVIDGE